MTLHEQTFTESSHAGKVEHLVTDHGYARFGLDLMSHDLLSTYHHQSHLIREQVAAGIEDRDPPIPQIPPQPPSQVVDITFNETGKYLWETYQRAGRTLMELIGIDLGRDLADIFEDPRCTVVSMHVAENYRRKGRIEGWKMRVRVQWRLGD